MLMGWPWHWGAVEHVIPLPGMKDSGLIKKHRACNTDPMERAFIKSGNRLFQVIQLLTLKQGTRKHLLKQFKSN